MTTSRRDFLAALAAGTGAVLMGRGWYKRGSGLVVPETATLSGTLVMPGDFSVGDWIVVSNGAETHTVRITRLWRNNNGLLVAYDVESV